MAISIKIHWKQIGEFSVDSWHVMLVDPCYVQNPELQAEILKDLMALIEHKRNDGSPGPIAQQVERLVVVSGTGDCDGGYPVYAQIEDGYVKALLVRFMD